MTELSPRDIEHDNPEFRRLEETTQLPRADLRPADLPGRHGHRDPLLADRRAPRRFGNGETPRPTRQRAWRVRIASSPPGCSSRRASRSGTRSSTSARGPNGGAGSEAVEELDPGDEGGVGAQLAAHVALAASLRPRLRGACARSSSSRTLIEAGRLGRARPARAAGGCSSRTASPRSSTSGTCATTKRVDERALAAARPGVPVEPRLGDAQRRLRDRRADSAARLLAID